MSDGTEKPTAAPVARVLIVDDEPDNIEVLARRLEMRNIAVLRADNGRDGGRIALTENVDLVLLDVMMPRMSGIETLHEIRKVKPSIALPVIMVTARDDKETIVEAMATGANDYVVKPFDFDVVLARIVAQLRVRNAFTTVLQDRAKIMRKLELRERLKGPGASD